jgi:Bacterial Ig domain
VIRLGVSIAVNTRGIAVAAVVVATALTASSRLTAQGTYTFTVIAPEGTNLGFPPPIAINNGGQVALVATPPSAPGGVGGVYRGDGTTLTLLYSSGSPQTQAPPSGSVAINAGGIVAFGTYGPAFGSRIVLSDGSGATHLNGPWVPGGEPSLNDAGQFVYEIQNGGVYSGVGIGSAIVPLAVPGDVVPGGTLTGSSFPLVNNIGQVVFLGGLSGGTGRFFRTSTTPGGPIVEMGSSGNGSLLFGLNDLGQIAYLGVPTVGPAAIYISDGVVETPVVVATANLLLEPHMTPINDLGHVAFVAADAAAVRRIYVWNGTGLWDVLGQGDTIPSLGTVLDFAIGNDSLNDRDQIALSVRYDDGSGVDKYGVVRADPINLPPTATDGSLSTNEDTVAAGTLSGADPHGDPLTFTLVGNGSLGTATVTNALTGAFTYTPNPDAFGTDTVTFAVGDGTFTSNTATVTVTIAPVNDAPIAADSNVLALSGQAVSDVLQATDVDGPALTFTIVSAPTRGQAVITDATTGAFSYTPPSMSSGSGSGTVTPQAPVLDMLTFQVTDGALQSNTATVTFTLKIDEPPTLTDLTVHTRAGRAVAGRVAMSPAASTKATFEVVSTPAFGTLRLAPDGAFVYRPRPDVRGVDRFSVRARVNGVTSNVAEVTVVIAPRMAPRR